MQSRHRGLCWILFLSILNTTVSSVRRTAAAGLFPARDLRLSVLVSPVAVAGLPKPGLPNAEKAWLITFILSYFLQILLPFAKCFRIQSFRSFTDSLSILLQECCRHSEIFVEDIWSKAKSKTNEYEFRVPTRQTCLSLTNILSLSIHCNPSRNSVHTEGN
jgi:hypothetical protein